MTSHPSWLVRLNAATNYRDLQEIFSEIVSDVDRGGDTAGLAVAVDEAVRRLQAERVRDAQSLAAAEAEYESFKQEQSGVVGWFKRHLPFTQTRKEELEHRGSIADQTAEVLADNLVIARAEMLKERLMDPGQRRLGHPSGHWRDRLQRFHGVPQPLELGPVLRELAAELDRSQPFLEQLQRDIDAFTNAAFADAQNRQRRDADVAAARHEYEVLRQEADEKARLRDESVQRVAQLAVAELVHTDASFRSDQQRQQQLRVLCDRLKSASANGESLSAAAVELDQLFEQRAKVPQEIEQLKRQATDLERQLNDAMAVRDRTARAWDQVRQTLEAARRDEENARLALEAAERMYQTVERQAEAGGAAIHAEATPADLELARVKEALERARRGVAAAAAPHDPARQEAERAAAAFQQVQVKLDEVRRQRTGIENRLPQLDLDLTAAQNRLRRSFDDVHRACASYLDQARSSAFATAWRAREATWGVRGWVDDHGPAEALCRALLDAGDNGRQDGRKAVEQLLAWLAADQKNSQQELATVGRRLYDAWRARCEAILGESLARSLPKQMPQSAGPLPD